MERQMATEPRGIRNSNPLNLRISDNAWQGKRCPNTDGTFEQFDSAIDGIRAGAKLFLTYYRDYGLDSVHGLIGRFAPSNENDTEAYVNDVAGMMTVSPSTPLIVDNQAILENLITAVTFHENGCCPYPMAVIAQAVSEALGVTAPA
jgi:hypothetical protein